MQMKRYNVTFESILEVTVYAPEDATLQEIQEIAEEIAVSPSIKGWDMPEYEANVCMEDTVDIPDEDLHREPPNKYGYRRVVKGALSSEEAHVLSDDRRDIVNPEDATWWESL